MIPQITTVIPTYRRPVLLRRAIESALAQEGVSVRVRVCDNASGDETAAIVQELSKAHPQIEYHCHPQNIGGAANFAFGVRNLETPYFSLLSDDDYLLPGFYRRAIERLELQAELGFWAGVTLNVDEHGTIWDARVERWPREGIFSVPEGLLALTSGMAPSWTGIVFRARVLDEMGFIDSETLGPSDLDYILRAAARYKYIVEKYPAAVLTFHNGSFSLTQPLSAFWPGWKKMLRNMDELANLKEADRKVFIEALHRDARRMLFRRAGNALAAGRLDFARDAADALENDYSEHSKAYLLRALSMTCKWVPGFQVAISSAYRMVERRIVRSRSGLQVRYGHLLKTI